MKPLFIIAAGFFGVETGACLAMKAPYTMAAFCCILGLVFTHLAASSK